MPADPARPHAHRGRNTKEAECLPPRPEEAQPRRASKDQSAQALALVGSLKIAQWRHGVAELDEAPRAAGLLHPERLEDTQEPAQRATARTFRPTSPPRKSDHTQRERRRRSSPTCSTDDGDSQASESSKAPGAPGGREHHAGCQESETWDKMSSAARRVTRNQPWDPRKATGRSSRTASEIS